MKFQIHSLFGSHDLISNLIVRQWLHFSELLDVKRAGSCGIPLTQTTPLNHTTSYFLFDGVEDSKDSNKKLQQPSTPDRAQPHNPLSSFPTQTATHRSGSVSSTHTASRVQL